VAAKRKYPWEGWFGKPRTELVRGVHYRCSQSTMAQTIRNNASLRGLRVQLTDKGNEIVIEVIGAIYLWDEWFDGRLLLIEKGTDYEGETDAMPDRLRTLIWPLLSTGAPRTREE
jgi:hypothetical protein